MLRGYACNLDLATWNPTASHRSLPRMWSSFTSKRPTASTLRLGRWIPCSSRPWRSTVAKRKPAKSSAWGAVTSGTERAERGLREIPIDSTAFRSSLRGGITSIRTLSSVKRPTEKLSHRGCQRWTFTIRHYSGVVVILWNTTTILLLFIIIILLSTFSIQICKKKLFKLLNITF